MGYYKKINGKNIYLSSIDLNDADIYLEMKNSKDKLPYIVFEGYKLNEVYDLEKAKNELNDLAVKNAFAIIDKNTNKFIGLIGLSNILSINQRSDMWIKMLTNIDYEDQILKGGEAVNLLLEYCYDIMNLHSIIMTFPSFNRQMIDICNYSNMQYLGKRTGSEQFYDRYYYDTIYFQCTPEIYNLKIHNQVRIDSVSRKINISNINEDAMSNIIQGENITLQKYNNQENYIGKMAMFLNNPRVSIPIGDYKTNWNDYRALKQLQSVDYVITKNNQLLGYINLFRKDYRNKTADLEILIGDPNEHQKGYGKEALNLFLIEQYKNGPFNNLLSCIFEFNKASMKLHESMEYDLIGVRKEGYFVNKKLNDMYLYELTKEVFNNKVKVRK